MFVGPWPDSITRSNYPEAYLNEGTSIIDRNHLLE